MNDLQQKVWAVAECHQLTSLIESKVNDFEAFCEALRGADEVEILTAIESLTMA